ncbi:hypothetical protein DFH94DRAFT_776064 [Russula ochroleuca]|uniref:Uncharacterized protein n=1 Tax=Russula ochroleuca TaxID=152965 RepID=A0A9P5JY49_9AGAM|nr:hypothetical protein DFH94DRAFT_776064 [Russula ochroleuca]
MRSTAFTRIFAVTLLAGFLPGVKADCWRDRDGSRVCDGMGSLAWIMIGLSILVVSLAVYFIFSYCWKQRKRRKLARAQQIQRGNGAAYRSEYGFDGPRPFAPQAPTPAHNGLNSPYNYDTTRGFAQPSVRSPQYRPQPPGVPPVTSDRKGTM